MTKRWLNSDSVNCFIKHCVNITACLYVTTQFSSKLAASFSRQKTHYQETQPPSLASAFVQTVWYSLQNTWWKTSIYYSGVAARPSLQYVTRHPSLAKNNLVSFCRWVNFLKPTGHVMHQQFNIQQLYVLPTLYLCVLYLSENKQRLVQLTA